MLGDEWWGQSGPRSLPRGCGAYVKSVGWDRHSGLEWCCASLFFYHNTSSLESAWISWVRVLHQDRPPSWQYRCQGPWSFSLQMCAYPGIALHGEAASGEDCQAQGVFSLACNFSKRIRILEKQALLKTPQSVKLTETIRWTGWAAWHVWCIWSGSEWGELGW